MAKACGMSNRKFWECRDPKAVHMQGQKLAGDWASPVLDKGLQSAGGPQEPCQDEWQEEPEEAYGEHYKEEDDYQPVHRGLMSSKNAPVGGALEMCRLVGKP